MPRGGAREGSGPDSTWRLGKTKAIRIPVVLADQLLKAARELDSKGSLKLIQVDRGSEEAVSILAAALTLKANAGGAIKIEIRKALEILREM
jgi:hypothetical protein